MKKLHRWLTKTPGMAAQLRSVLDVNATCISNVRYGHRPMPTRWMPEIARLSNGEITVHEMVVARNKVSAKMKAARLATNSGA